MRFSPENPYPVIYIFENNEIRDPEYGQFHTLEQNYRQESKDDAIKKKHAFGRSANNQDKKQVYSDKVRK